ncbi:trigger factor [Cryptosporangium arvum]|uniref:Trigger factor n=1 Tax=Cryptosporangium arvum DSM 44712 TaxID=927661 RepID=A0A010ZNV6_9ACTN|nr:trigger factor [Cryptosporangium arvum]EXG80364.1 trigger factor [Cryptosporangium arvum DSM 44712]
MKSTVETLSPTRVRLAVEVPFEELKPNLDEAYRSIASQVSIPGFRKGKVPPRLIDQRIGRAAVLEETLNNAIPTHYSSAVREHDIKVIGRPDVEVTELQDGEKVSFTAEVDVRPELALPDYSTLEVTVDEAIVSDEDIDNQVDSLRQRFSTLKGVERAVRTGDFVQLDLVATINGEEIEGGSAENVSYEVGSGQLLEGTDAAIEGHEAGEEVTFTTTLAGGEHAGQDADVKVTIRTVKEKELPELDDEFAQTASEFDTLDELKDDVRNRLGRVKKLEQAVAARDKTLEALLEAVEVPMPEKVLADEIEYRRHQLGHALENAGVTLEQYLENEGQTQEEFDEQLDKDCAQAVRSQLVLDAVADAEEVGIDDGELTSEVVRRAQQSGVNPQQFADQLVQNGELPIVVADLRRGKALGVVTDQAKIVDSAGNPVDLKALQDEINPAQADSEAESAPAQV